MKKLNLLALVGLVAITTGCSQFNWPSDNQNWDRINRNITNATELAATVAFARDDVKDHHEHICAAAQSVSTVLANFNDTDATFAEVREVALQAVKDMTSDSLPSYARPIAVLVVDQILDVVFVYVEGSYSDLVSSSEGVIAISVARAVADGLTAACNSVTPLSNEPQGMAKFSIEKN